MAKIVKWNPPQFPVTRAVFSWNVWYAIFAHEGFTRKDGSKAPARRWTDTTLQEIDVIDAVVTEVKTTNDVSDGFMSFCHKLFNEFQANIESDRWQWDRTTVRRNGETVGSPRDIVDSGDLRDSQKLDFY